MASATGDIEEMEFETPDEESEFSFEMQDEGEYEASNELEIESETDEELEYEAEEEMELELGDEMEYEGQDEGADSVNRLAERLYEFATTSFESEYEADERLAGILNEAERDFFFKKLKDVAKKALKSKLGKLTQKIPVLGKAVQVGTSLLRGDLKGALGTLVKSGVLKSALSLIPGAGPVITALEPALKAAGVQLEVPDTDEGRKQFATDVAYVTRESYDYLAKTMADPGKKINLSNPIQSNKLANKALTYGLKRAKMEGRPSFAGGLGGRMQNRQKRRRIHKIYVKKDEAAIILPV
jgi:hypothetical protein